MITTLTPAARIPRATTFDLRRNGKKVGTVQRLTDTLWIAALDNPPAVYKAESLRDLRDILRRLDFGKE